MISAVDRRETAIWRGFRVCYRPISILWSCRRANRSKWRNLRNAIFALQTYFAQSTTH